MTAAHDFDLVVLGSGFGGALMSAVARRLGRSVLLVERGSHPRFAVGESTSPLANIVLAEIAARYDLPRLAPLAEHGSWLRAYPEIRRGIKRGFTFYHHAEGEPHRRGRERQLLVAASPNDEVADTHWLRADVDHFFVREAVAAGVEYVDETEVTGVDASSHSVAIRCERRGRAFSARARLAVDATGPRGALSRALGVPEAPLPDMPPTHTVFSHFENVARCAEMDDFRVEGEPPYPPDAAAVHHVFDGGWVWVLRFDDGVTSAGVMLDERRARDVRVRDGAAAWERFLSRYPSVRAQFAESRAILPFVWSERVSYRASAAAGESWAMLPSAAGFVDPLFSTGIPLTLLGVERLGRILERDWGTGALAEGLLAYGETTLAEVDHTSRYVAACYRAFPSFGRFADLSMFYFAAASYAEMARRVGRHERARRFLGLDRPAFVGGMRECAASGGDVAAAIEPLNVAGLADPAKRNWYGVDVEDTAAAAHKLGATADDVRRACGL